MKIISECRVRAGPRTEHEKYLNYLSLDVRCLWQEFLENSNSKLLIGIDGTRN